MMFIKAELPYMCEHLLTHNLKQTITKWAVIYLSLYRFTPL